MKDLKRILIADDDAGHRKLLKGMLGGCEIDEVSTVRTLIEKAKTTKYDLIVTDYDMQEDRSDTLIQHGRIIYPEQTGTYAIGKIREFDKETPIIMNSSSNDFPVVVNAFLKGADYFLEKKSLNTSEVRKVFGKYI